MALVQTSAWHHCIVLLFFLLLQVSSAEPKILLLCTDNCSLINRSDPCSVASSDKTTRDFLCHYRKSSFSLLSPIWWKEQSNRWHLEKPVKLLVVGLILWLDLTANWSYNRILNLLHNLWEKNMQHEIANQSRFLHNRFKVSYREEITMQKCHQWVISGDGGGT